MTIRLDGATIAYFKGLAGPEGVAPSPGARAQRAQQKRVRMALSTRQHAQVSNQLAAYCDARIPSHVRDTVRLSFRIRRNEVVLFEERPAFRPPHDWSELPVAKFKDVATQRLWRLYCMHRDLCWHAYQLRPAARRFKTSLAEVDADPTGIFFG